jgi:diguanylate cyclase (GGDEF)-like protein
MEEPEREAELLEPASDREARASQLRDLTAEQHDAAARLRDVSGEQRDRAADLRDAVSDARDEKADMRDRADEMLERSREDPESPDGPTRATVNRQYAAADRGDASRDRQAAAIDRAQARFDREMAAADRQLAATSRSAAEVERRAAWSELRRAEHDRREASLDGLTGAFLRAPGLRRLVHQMEDAHQERSSLVVAFVDVDGLKQINDTAGHAAGDQTLIWVALMLRANLRAGDTIIRYGGDEFIGVLAGATVEHTQVRLSVLNDALAQSPLPVSISFGLAEMSADDTCDDLLARADAALLATRRHHRRTTGPQQPG